MKQVINTSILEEVIGIIYMDLSDLKAELQKKTTEENPRERVNAQL